MPNTHQTLQDIADILSFESDKTLLKARLETIHGLGPFGSRGQ